MNLKSLIANPLGFGTAPLGNMFRNVPEDEVQATVDAAWNNGVRYFDSAPFYGAGLSESRLGNALVGRPRDEYVLSTKVGRIILDELEDPAAPVNWSIPNSAAIRVTSSRRGTPTSCSTREDV